MLLLICSYFLCFGCIAVSLKGSNREHFSVTTCQRFMALYRCQVVYYVLYVPILYYFPNVNSLPLGGLRGSDDAESGLQSPILAIRELVGRGYL